MKKMIVLGLVLSLNGIFAISEAKVHIKQKSKSLKTEVPKTEIKKAVLQLSRPHTLVLPNVVTQKIEPPKMIAAQGSSFPISHAHRSLLLPQGLKEALGSFEYRYLNENHLGTNVSLGGRYGAYERWEFLGEISGFPQTQVGFEFGGIRAGFLYRALNEDEKNPELALGVRVGLLGKGAYSLTKDNSLGLFPNVLVKRQVSDRLSLLGELMLGIGNNEAGVASVNVNGILKMTPDVDALLKIDLENIGYTFDQIFSLTPTIEYHWNKDKDVFGGTHLGLVGANNLGNNFFVGLVNRF